MLTLTCSLEDFDTSTQTCSDPVWVSAAGSIPPLSAADGALLATAVITLWCVGAAFRWARKSMVR